MKEIKLTKGKIAVVDDEDYELVSQWKWTATLNSIRGKEKWYAVRQYRQARRKYAKMYLHRFLMQPPTDMVVDHINGDGLDCRRANLRIITQDENTAHCRFKRKARDKLPNF